MELITVGEAFEDLIFLDLPRLPRLGEEVRTRQFVATMGGGAVISAVAAARLGIHCRIVSGLSDAAAARLTREGIGFENLRHPEERPAISAALSVGGNRSFVTFNGVNDSLEPRFRRALDKQTARHVHFAFHPRSCQRWARAVTRLRRASVTTSWDFGWNEALLRDRSFEHLVTSLDYVFFNRQEAVLYARHRRMAAAVAYWRQLRANVVIKLGSHGSRWLGEVDLRMPARRARVVDTTGAGDAFNGGFLAARLRGLDARTSLGLGNLVGTASIGRAGGVDGLPALADLPGPLRRLLTATRAPQRPTASPGHPRDGRKRR